MKKSNGCLRRVTKRLARLTCLTGQATIVGDSWRELHGGREEIWGWHTQFQTEIRMAAPEFRVKFLKFSLARLTCPTGQATIVGDSWRESHGGSARDDPHNRP